MTDEHRGWKAAGKLATIITILTAASTLAANFIDPVGEFFDRGARVWHVALAAAFTTVLSVLATALLLGRQKVVERVVEVPAAVVAPPMVKGRQLSVKARQTAADVAAMRHETRSWVEVRAINGGYDDVTIAINGPRGVGNTADQLRHTFMPEGAHEIALGRVDSGDIHSLHLSGSPATFLDVTVFAEGASWNKKLTW